jgi:hypothetical protein
MAFLLSEISNASLDGLPGMVQLQKIIIVTITS